MAAGAPYWETRSSEDYEEKVLKKAIKSMLRKKPELLQEVILELRKEKIKKLKI